MTKEQFAEKKYPFPDERKEKIACILGWEAHEAQCPGDAQKFAMWAARFYRYEFSLDNWVNKADGSRLLTHELYQLFNPSGAAPKPADDAKCPYCHGDGFIRTVEDGTHQMGCPFCEARNDAMDEYKELPAPKPAGPVWVTNGLPVETDMYICEVEHKIPGKRTVWPAYMQYVKGDPSFMGLKENESVFRWLNDDESAPQVFTREQLEKAWETALCGSNAYTFEQYMATNYPPAPGTTFAPVP